MKIRYPIRAGLYVALVVGLAAALLIGPAKASSDEGDALIAAVRAGRADTVRELVGRGADIDAAVSGDGTALIQRGSMR